MKLHIAKHPWIAGGQVPTPNLCGGNNKSAIGWALWGMVGRNRKDKCKSCLRIYRKRKGISEMSYCRWSTDDFQCDIYCYESCGGGWNIHVAANRPVLKDGDLPPRIPFSQENKDAWVAQWMKVMEWIRTAERRPIGLAHDGESYNEPTALDAVNRLLALRADGYNVPQDAIDALLEEAQDEAAA